MISSISPTQISESYRLSISGMHQGILIAMQSDFDGLRIKAPGVLMEISRAALNAASIEKFDHECKIVKPVLPSSKSNTHYPYHQL